MNTVKSVIFIACIIGVITSMTDIATPEGTLKKQLRSVLAVILLLAVITPVMGHGFKVTLSDYTELADLPEFDNVSTATKLYYLSESESRLEEYFLDKLHKYGIENVRVDITTDINQYNEIEINMHKKIKKHIDNLLNTHYNKIKQIVELFKILAEFRDGFNNVLSAFRHWMLLII